MLTGEQAYALAKKSIHDATQGISMVEGKPCTIKSISDITGGHRVTFEWTADDGTTKTESMDVMDGVQGIQGPKGETGNTGATGATGPAGANGQAATIQVGTVSSGASAGVTNSGTSQNAVFNFVLPKGDKGEKGADGADGADGKSFEIKARFQTEADLIAAYPSGPANPSDAYFVGTGNNPDLYVWLTESSEWHNSGKIAGVKGDKGDTGDDGFSPVASVSKSGNTVTISIRDKTGQTTATVQDGADGNDGADGSDGKSAYEIAVDEGFVGTKAEWLASLKGDPGTHGTNGQNGADGVSPVANVTENNGVYTIRIQDASGTTEETIDMSDFANAEQVADIQAIIPEDASPSNKLITKKDVHQFTSSEQRVGTWSDGKPVYERTVEFAHEQYSATSTTRKISFAGWNVKKFTTTNWMASWGNSSGYNPQYYFCGDVTVTDGITTAGVAATGGQVPNYTRVYIDMKNKNICLEVSSKYATSASTYCGGVLTVRYTKTTD